MEPMISYDIFEVGKKGGDVELIEIRRTAKPFLQDAAGRRQWQKETEQQDREVIATIPFSDLGPLLKELTAFATYFIPDTPPEEN